MKIEKIKIFDKKKSLTQKYVQIITLKRNDTANNLKIDYKIQVKQRSRKVLKIMIRKKAPVRKNLNNLS